MWQPGGSSRSGRHAPAAATARAHASSACPPPPLPPGATARSTPPVNAAVAPFLDLKPLQGNTEDVGEDYNVEAADDAPRPFQVRRTHARTHARTLNAAAGAGAGAAAAAAAAAAAGATAAAAAAPSRQAALRWRPIAAAGSSCDTRCLLLRRRRLRHRKEETTAPGAGQLRCRRPRGPWWRQHPRCSKQPRRPAAAPFRGVTPRPIALFLTSPPPPPPPLQCILDTGLKRTSTGSKVFAALKVRGTAAAGLSFPGWVAAPSVQGVRAAGLVSRGSGSLAMHSTPWRRCVPHLRRTR